VEVSSAPLPPIPRPSAGEKVNEKQKYLTQLKSSTEFRQRPPPRQRAMPDGAGRKDGEKLISPCDSVACLLHGSIASNFLLAFYIKILAFWTS
jgi:hypothetical protein